MEDKLRRATGVVLVAGVLCAAAGAQETIYTHTGGGSAGNGLGHALDCAGDVDGDGVSDLIGGYRTGSGSKGTARVWSGADGSLLWTFTGAAAGDLFGRSVAGAGDVDGDGRDDLIVGAAGADANGVDSGRALVYSGADGSVLHDFAGPFTRARFGQAVAGLGDVDGDGRGDLAVSGQPDSNTPQPAGFVRIFSGADGALIRELVGSVSTSRLGCSLANAGDVDGDGCSDLVVGDWRDGTLANAAGAVRVFSGASGSELRAFFGTASNDRLGQAVAAAGDVNGDGIADLLAGAPWADGASVDVGQVRVWSGADGSVLHSLTGDSSYDFFGASVAGVGDADGDGLDDFGVGAFADDDGGTNAGSARIYSGADGSVIFRVDGNSAADELGYSLARAGDVDGDGGEDFALGAPVDDSGGGSQSGTVTVHRGLAPVWSGPQSYCKSSPNLLGDGAWMGWSGSTSAAADDFVLEVGGAMPNSAGLFLFGADGAEEPFFRGTLCIAPPIWRLPPAVQLGSGGGGQRAIERGQWPWLAELLDVGTTWNFQFLYLDTSRREGRPFNLSDALRVTFTP